MAVVQANDRGIAICEAQKAEEVRVLKYHLLITHPIRTHTGINTVQPGQIER